MGVSKFGNKFTVCHAQHKHRSKREAQRCDELHLMQKAGVIKNLQADPQPRFPLRVNDVLVGTYVADFEYWEKGRHIIEDVKGMVTQVYRLKRNLVKALYGITISEV